MKTKLPKGVTTGYSNQYRAYITVEKKKLYLGTFRKAEQAAEAYQKARQKYYGETPKTDH